MAVSGSPADCHKKSILYAQLYPQLREWLVDWLMVEDLHFLRRAEDSCVDSIIRSRSQGLQQDPLLLLAWYDLNSAAELT
jgi:hypothetical protein